MPDTVALSGMSDSSQLSWVLVPFVDPVVKTKTAQFKASLANARGQSVPALEKWLRNSANVHKLLTDYVADLKSAYAAISSDINITSMCLYSGPVPTFNTVRTDYFGVFGRWCFSECKENSVAWLGLGDAALAEKKRRSALFKHYGNLLNEVVTLTLPHHGSDHNFHTDLLEKIRPCFCVASADKFSDWRHPGSLVAQAVSSTGRFMSVVTSNEESEV